MPHALGPTRRWPADSVLRTASRNTETPALRAGHDADPRRAADPARQPGWSGAKQPRAGQQALIQPAAIAENPVVPSALELSTDPAQNRKALRGGAQRSP